MTDQTPAAPSPEDVAAVKATAKEEGQDHWSRELALALWMHGKVIHDEGLTGDRAGEEGLRIIRRRIARRMLKGINRALLAGTVVHQSLTPVIDKDDDGNPVPKGMEGHTYTRPPGHEKPWQKRRRKRREARL